MEDLDTKGFFVLEDGSKSSDYKAKQKKTRTRDRSYDDEEEEKPQKLKRGG